MTEDDESPRMFCGACGVIFGMDDLEQDAWDDVKCPDCGSGDVGGTDDLDDEEDEFNNQGGW